MSWWRVAWRLLAYRPAVSLLNILTLSLGLAAMILVMLVSGQIRGQFDRDLQGIDLVVGAKGSPLQLLLAGVFHIDLPTGNIPLSMVDTLRSQPLVAQVIPLSLGDSYRGLRIVGTEPAYLAQYDARLVKGRLWTGPMQAVLGAQAARETGLDVDGRFVGQHGLGERGHAHGDSPYTVVGVLAPTGGVLDRLILTDLSSVWQVHEKAVALDESDRAALAQAREVTLLQVRYRSPLAAVTLPRWVNTETDAQAAVPAMEMARLSRLIGIGSQLIEAFAGLLMVLAGLSIFAALYAMVEDRLADLALMRLVGAPRSRLVQVVLLQASALGLAALLIGLALGHGATELLGRLLAEQRSVPLTGAWIAPGEVWAVAGALFTVWLAALIPALKAYRVDVDRWLIG